MNHMKIYLNICIVDCVREMIYVLGYHWRAAVWSYCIMLCCMLAIRRGTSYRMQLEFEVCAMYRWGGLQMIAKPPHLLQQNYVVLWLYTFSTIQLPCILWTLLADMYKSLDPMYM